MMVDPSAMSRAASYDVWNTTYNMLCTWFLTRELTGHEFWLLIGAVVSGCLILVLLSVWTAGLSLRREPQQ